MPYGQGEEVTRNKIWHSLDNFKVDKSNLNNEKEIIELKSWNSDIKVGF